MTPVLVDSNVLLDIATDDANWSEWSARTLERIADEALLIINPLVYAETSIGFDSIEELEDAVPPHVFRRDPPADARCSPLSQLFSRTPAHRPLSHGTPG